MKQFGREADQPVRAYFTGGVTAVLLGWRDATIDIDLEIIPENDRLLRSLPALKENLHINIETRISRTLYSGNAGVGREKSFHISRAPCNLPPL
jgi:hypothetical protein